MKVHFSATEALGGGHLRSIWPAESLRGAGYDATWAVGEDVPLDAEVVVVHRPLSATRAGLVHRLKAEGRTVLVDEDDALDLAWQSGNEIARVLWDGDRKQLHDDSIRQADGLIVTTDALAEVYGCLNEHVYLTRNRLPEWVGRVHWWGSSEVPIVSWHGIVKTHRLDLEWLRPVSARAFAGAHVQVIGDPGALWVMGAKGQAFPYQEDLRALYKLMARADIGLVPLLPCRFNECKSWLKALEYMTLGIPVVATDLPEMWKLIEHGVTGFLAESPEAFAGYVQELVNDAALRQSMGAAAFEAAEKLALDSGEWEATVGAAQGLLHRS